MLVWCIAKYTHSPDDSKTKDGWRLLVEGELYTNLKNEVSQSTLTSSSLSSIRLHETHAFDRMARVQFPHLLQME